VTPKGVWPYLILGLALLGVGLAFWHPIPAGVWHDDGVYVLTGRALARGGGLRYVGVPGSPPAVKFPPGYPAFLAGLWLVLGTLGRVTLAAELLNLVMVAAAGAITAWAVRKHAGFTPAMAFGAAAVGFVSADVWRPAIVPLSEPLFMFIAAGALAAWGYASRPGDRRGLVTLSLILVAAVLTRSAGIAVVLGCGVGLAFSRSVRSAFAATLPALSTAVAWGAWAGSRAKEIPEGARDVLGPYGSWLASQVFGAPRAFLAGLPSETWAVGKQISYFLLPGLGGWKLGVAVAPLAVIALWGLVRLFRVFPPMAWSVGAYIAMLMVWPFVNRRLVTPLYPWAVVALAAGLVEVVRRSPQRARQGVLIVALVWVGAYATVTADRAARGWVVAGYHVRSERLATAISALERTTPAGSVVGAPEFWPAVILHGEWQSIPSARFKPRSEDEATPLWGTPEQQLQLWWDYRVDHVLLEQNGRIHGDALNLLENTCPGTVFVLAKMSAEMLVQLKWDEACATKLGLSRGG
jgi:hypothetical protein